MPAPEVGHERANEITIAAIRIARRDGRTAAERARIYEREIERLIDAEPAYRTPPPPGLPEGAPQQQPAGFLFRF